MILVLTMCLGLQCEVHRIPMLREIIATQCALKAQEFIAEKVSSGFFGEGYQLARYSCERRKDRSS